WRGRSCSGGVRARGGRGEGASHPRPGSGRPQPAPCFHAVPPSDPLRQANRLPIKVLKMLTARTGHILHPEYLQPLPSTPVSPIELDAKKSPLALLAQTCSQIGKPDPSPSSKLSSVTSNGSGGDKDSKSGPLKLSDIGVEDKSSFKPYSKPGAEKKEPGAAGCAGAPAAGVAAGEKSGFRVPSATCQPFTPRTGSPNSSSGSSGSEGGPGTTSISHSRISVSCAGINVEVNQHQESTPGSKPIASDSASSCSSTTATSSTSVLGSGLVAPVSPYKPGQTVFPLPPAGMSYPGTLAGAYAGYPPQFLPHGVALDPTKSSSLVGAQLAAASSLGCSKPAGSSPLAGASPPSVMTASLCRDPYCLSYHCASHLAGAAGASCAHDQALKSGYPLVYPTHPLHSVHSSLTGATPPSLAGHPLYPYGFMLPNDPQPHICNWVSANGPCDKRFATSEELLSHLRTHTAFPAPRRWPAQRLQPWRATGPYYSPYALYGQRLTTASALGYQ
uniref:Zinc finger protein 503 n=1 Tax=Malurus cyaneus samueli TaxID=2593467 RepID=A0A8C5TY22_9PASS